MEALESELTCPVCLELFEEPLLLPCLHSMCRKCTEMLDTATKKAARKKKALNEGGAAAWKREPPRQPKGGAKLCCPTCRTEVPLDERGVDGLSRNMVLQNIVDRFRDARDKEKHDTAPPCQLCEGNARPTVKVCINCDVAYCEACLSTFHPARGPLAKHTLVTPGQYKGKAEAKVVMCAEHADEKVNMYCKVDEMPVCALCMMVGKHKGHQGAALSDAYKEKKDVLIEEVSALKDRNKEISQFVTAMHETCSKVQEEEKKLKLLKEEITKKEKHLQEAQSVVAYVEEVLKEKDQSCFLQAVKSTRERVKKSHDRDHLAAPADWEFKGFDFSGEAEALMAMDLSELVTSWHQCVQELSASSQGARGGRYSYQHYQWATNNLVDGQLDTYWRSDNDHEAQHWLQLQLRPGFQARTLRLSLVPQPAPEVWTENNKPVKVTVLTGDDFKNMTVLETVHVGKEQREIPVNIEAAKSFLKLKFCMKTPSYCIVSQLSIVASKPKANGFGYRY
ncbi:MID1 [Branchiostoma lanceolatum]|uniref:MID1 protein n=1 Tax=Branchiostoma lanceolatum TaxID=7740 RepID=A0A8J9W0C3_BRALA|nr:MID1 [Branchiostoma lanceolatum]